jgi:hypothetical protein
MAKHIRCEATDAESLKIVRLFLEGQVLNKNSSVLFDVTVVDLLDYGFREIVLAIYLDAASTYFSGIAAFVLVAR